MLISKSLQLIMFRHLNDSYIKEKWVLETGLVSSITKGYEENSPLGSKIFFFGGRPLQENVLSISGVQQGSGSLLVQVVFENKIQVNKWLDILEILTREKIDLNE